MPGAFLGSGENKGFSDLGSGVYGFGSWEFQVFGSLGWGRSISERATRKALHVPT